MKHENGDNTTTTTTTSTVRPIQPTTMIRTAPRSPSSMPQRQRTFPIRIGHYLLVYLLAMLLLLGGQRPELWGVRAGAYKCSRTPEGHGAMKSPADGRFHVRISESAAKYTPGKTYTIGIEGIDAGVRQMPHSVRHKFSGFMLVVEGKSLDSAALMDGNPTAYGTFSLLQGSSLTKITCANMVMHTTTTPKSEIQVLWTAPEPGTGCVAFRATVIEHRDIWYMDDGPLTKEFCEDEQTIDDTLSGTIDPCCACAEAKYELTFEGLWSRNTHPKDFPSNNWLTRFSDIIGATHTVDYRFWHYGGTASPGLKQVAEHGATKELESELKGESDNIRTIIKARGLAFPNVTGKTFAVFRVDQLHHLMSFVSMIDPSPDWFLGVSGLELCLANCSWVESKVLDLYPWDAGTDSGPTYISPDQPTFPLDNIRRIRPDQPNDPRSPFYDPNTYTMKPLARLYLLRQRLYEKNCPEEQEGDGNGGNTDGGNGGGAGGEATETGGGGGNGGRGSGNPCATGPWSRYSRCSSDCSKGTRTRQRNWLNEAAAQQAGCRNKLAQRVDCVGKQAHCTTDATEGGGAGGGDEEEHVTEAQCALTAWTEWSECVPKCGNGQQMRRRKYVEKRAKKKCEGGDYHPLLVETQDCQNPKCVGEITPSEEEQQEDDDDNNDNNDRNNNSANNDNTDTDPDAANEDTDAPAVDNRPNRCLNDNWTAWTPCSMSCGGGQKMRYRRRKPTVRCRDVQEPEESRLCNETPCSIPNYCWQDPVGGGCRRANATNMFFFNRNATRCDVFTYTCGRHRNRFETEESCMTTCTGRSPELIEKEEREEAERLEREEQRRNSNRRNRPRFNGR